MSALDAAFALASPRLRPRPTGIAGYLIAGAVGGGTLLLLASPFVSAGLLSWASGIAFILYDLLLLLFVAWQTLPLAVRRPPASPDETVAAGSRPSLTVIIAAWNEAPVLERTIAALTAQNDPPEHILIADDGSTDDTALVLIRAYGFAPPTTATQHQTSPLHPRLAWLRVPHGGKARTLNRALAHIDTDIVVTVDADTHPAVDALARMRQAFAHDDQLVAATGVLAPACKASLGGRLLGTFQSCEYVRNFVSRYAWMRADSLLLVSGAFAGYRRDALTAVGGFDPECLVEDYELIHRLHRHACAHGKTWRVRVVGQARARTSAPSDLRAFLRQRRRWFAGFLQTQLWNRDMIGNRRFGKLGLLMLPVKTLDTVQPLLGLAASATLLGLVAGGHLPLATAILSVLLNKVLLDIVFHTWCLYLYRRWTAGEHAPGYSQAIATALLEPFSFQILRHLGAALGWHHFLTGRRNWGKQARHAMG
ncbi:MAG: glycosyltransferase family 2 protein [Proteobacteria bacterium]|nr:glycosyltransferase family 2 protein [Pseudomonadota bacterium]